MRKVFTSSGFTMVELMVGAVLLVVLGTGILGLQYVLGKGQVASMDQFITVNTGNYAISDIAREIRNARNSDNGSYLIETAKEQDIVFYSDIDADGKTEKIRYYLDGSDLKKSVTKPSGSPVVYSDSSAKTKTVAENIRNGTAPIFFYYNGSWPQELTSNVSEIRMVQIFLRINSKEESENTDYILDTFSSIRTIKTNL